MKNPVPVIVVAQLFGTSLWFSANSAADDLIRTWGISPADIGTLTNAVQLGFILGTLTFAVSGLADRYPASRIFAVCAILGALGNAAFALFAGSMAAGVPLRFAVGFCLAGVYPLGMKLVVSWVPERAGAALAQLVGMLTLGTALPHGIRLAGAGWSWQATILVSSALALVAAAMIFSLGDGPHLKRRHDALHLHVVCAAHRIVIEAYCCTEFYFTCYWSCPKSMIHVGEEQLAVDPIRIKYGIETTGRWRNAHSVCSLMQKEIQRRGSHQQSCRGIIASVTSITSACADDYLSFCCGPDAIGHTDDELRSSLGQETFPLVCLHFADRIVK